MASGIGGRIGMYRQRMTVMIMTLMPTWSRSPLQNRPSNIIKHCSIIVRVLTVPCSPSYTRIFVKKFSSFHLGVSGLSGGKKKNQTYQAFLCLTAKDTNITESSQVLGQLRLSINTEAFQFGLRTRRWQLTPWRS